MEPKLRYMFLKTKLTGTKVNWHVTAKFEPSPKSRTTSDFYNQNCILKNQTWNWILYLWLELDPETNNSKLKPEVLQKLKEPPNTGDFQSFTVTDKTLTFQ